MTDQQILSGAGPTPVAITLDVAQRLLPKLAFAAFDGTGAAGDFLPVVKFVGPGGLVAGQAVGDVVTAGASVDQTWFRGLAKQTKGGGAGPVEVFHDGFGPSAANLAWTALPWVHQAGGNLLNLVAPTAPTFINAGVYAVTACARDQSGTTWPGSINLWLDFNGEFEDHASITTASADTGIGGFSRIPQVTVTEVRTVFAGEKVQAFTSQSSGVAKNIGLIHAVVQQIA